MNHPLPRRRGPTLLFRAILLLAIVCTTSPVRADTRTWTDNTGKFAVEAELVEVKDGKAMLKRSDGLTIAVPIERLSEADQAFLKRHADAVAAKQPFELPGAMTEAPKWLADDPSVPFDLAAFFAAPPPGRNAAQAYLSAFANEFDTGDYFEIPGLDAERDRDTLERIRDRKKARWKAFDEMQDQYGDFDEDPSKAGEPTVEQMDQALQPLRPGIEEIKKAQLRPNCRFQPDRGFDALLPHCPVARDVARVLVMEARLALRRGQADMAIELADVTLRLSRDLRPGGEEITQLVSSSIEGMVLASALTPEDADPGLVERILASPDITTKQCDRLLAVLRHHRESRIDSLEEGLCAAYVTRRIVIHDVQTGDYKQKMDDLTDEPVRKTPISYLALVDESLQLAPNLEQESVKEHPVLGRVNTSDERARARAMTEIDEAIRRMNDEGYTREKAALNECYEKLATLGNGPYRETEARIEESLRPLATTYIAFFLGPGYVQVQRSVALRMEASHSGTECLVAMKRWQLERRSQPRNLASILQAVGIDEIPADPFSDQPLRTAMVDDQLVVYSIGPDGQDDGGQLMVYEKMRGDFVFRLRR